MFRGSLLAVVILALIATASPASAARRRIAVGAILNPSCSSIRAYGDWTADPDQATITFTITDLTTGVGASQSHALTIGRYDDYEDFSSFSNSPLDHRFLVTASIKDASDNVILSGKARLRLPCSS
jgi:hypothetical protein